MMALLRDVMPCSLEETDMVQMFLLPPSSGQAVTTCETSVNFDKTTWHNIPENSRSSANKSCEIYKIFIIHRPFLDIKIHITFQKLALSLGGKKGYPLSKAR
jgi:hypothetical protein